MTRKPGGLRYFVFVLKQALRLSHYICKTLENLDSIQSHFIPENKMELLTFTTYRYLKNQTLKVTS